MGRFLQIAGLVIGLIGLVLQFCITIPASMAVLPEWLESQT